MKYCVEKPYPEVKVKQKNSFYADLLLNDYAGITSELSAITTYSYQNFSIFKNYKEIANNLIKIAIVEMHHLELLGKTIYLLGKNPSFIYKERNTYPYKYWNSSFVPSNTNIFNILQNNILSEKQAICNYEYHISLIKDIYIKELLERIIADEKVHIKCFQIMLKEVSKNKKLV